MSVKVTYDENSRMRLDGMECGCACEHHEVTADIYVGKGLLQKVPRMIRARGLGTHCVLVADGNTWPIAGAAVEAALKADGFDVISCVIRRQTDVLPDDEACGEVLLSITRQTEFLISVGSGSLTDITRINSERTGLKFVAVGTAPSMDGYTSALSPLLHRGLKIQVPAVSPEIIVCDLDVLATAPAAMIASGVGDVLGKYIALTDWKLGEIINGEPCCPLCVSLISDALEKLMGNMEDIVQKTERGMQLLIEALLLAGITGKIIDNTRAVASVEHNIAQYWEMCMVRDGLEPPMHGASVGVATLLVWPFFERFLAEDLSAIDTDALKSARKPRAEREAWLKHCYGEEGGSAIARENPGDFLTWEEQLRRVRAAQENAEAIRAVLRAMPKQAEIRRVMELLGAEMTPEEEHIPVDLLHRSMWCGKDYRTRYTLMKLLDECGLLPRYLEKYPYEWTVEA